MATLKQSFAGQPFKILAFPCNEFLHQEPGSNAVIEKFAAGFGNFSMMAKSDVNSECQSSDAGQCAPASTECCSANNAVYPYLKGVLPGKISWNFTSSWWARTARRSSAMAQRTSLTRCRRTSRRRWPKKEAGLATGARSRAVEVRALP
jgi:glutathione peroxidase-family protein